MTQDQRGMSLIELMVALTMMVTASLSVFYLIMQVSRTQRSTDNQRVLLNYRNVILSSLRSTKGWQSTVNAPFNQVTTVSGGGLACLKDRTDCRNKGGPIAVLNANAFIVSNPLVANYGFERGGRNCTTFNPEPGLGVDDCPFRWEVEWEPICPPTGTCLNPDIVIKGRLRYNSASNKDIVNVQKYSFETVKGLDQNSFANACMSLQGTLVRDAVTGVTNCILPMAGQCPPGSFVFGLHTNAVGLNSKRCRPVIGKCADGQVLVGFTATGGLDCRASCTGIIPPDPVPPTPAPIPFDPAVPASGYIDYINFVDPGGWYPGGAAAGGGGGAGGGCGAGGAGGGGGGGGCGGGGAGS